MEVHVAVIYVGKDVSRTYHIFFKKHLCLGVNSVFTGYIISFRLKSPFGFYIIIISLLRNNGRFTGYKLSASHSVQHSLWHSVIY